MALWMIAGSSTTWNKCRIVEIFLALRQGEEARHILVDGARSWKVSVGQGFRENHKLTRHAGQRLTLLIRCVSFYEVIGNQVRRSSSTQKWKDGGFVSQFLSTERLYGEEGWIVTCTLIPPLP
ncbi:unnamed protein product [Hapterophycus canaliculatus]